MIRLEHHDGQIKLPRESKKGDETAGSLDLRFKNLKRLLLVEPKHPISLNCYIYTVET
jgi:hypothetical protein